MAENTVELVEPVKGVESVKGQPEPELVAEDLIEEVSIDGMCGVY